MSKSAGNTDGRHQQWYLRAKQVRLLYAYVFRCTTIDPRPRKLSRAQHLALQRDGMRLPTEESHLQAEFGPALWEDPMHAALLAESSLVVGMHPDQVTPR